LVKIAQGSGANVSTTFTYFQIPPRQHGWRLSTIGGLDYWTVKMYI
jgi:hypothetical protein